ncbi:hypothetical protein BD626DRAFT_556026 [Schizophyllum amplum]|uniref:Carboxypeptidase M14A n=1 Tax=Schizophyllum amplum TaxID=97359 RepID=A0A550CMN2_9AGAR|nr:hypothetical protein BD626DRAFT_556026 [Auriculariopsis ampla]
MLSWLVLAPLTAVCAAALQQSADYASKYDGVRVLRVPGAVDALVNSYGLTRWDTRGTHIDVQVPASVYDDFMNAVATLGANATQTMDVMVMHEDLGASIREESAGMLDYKRPEESEEGLVGLVSESWFLNYHSYADHLQYLDDLVATYPDNAAVFTSGTSLQGNPITGINLYGSGGSGSAPAVVIHGTVHAREWIAAMVSEGFAYSLLANYTAGDEEAISYLESYDIYIIPNVNPDGFIYSQEEERMWRKTRDPPPSGSTCYGVDINRNWAHASWGQARGASTDPCAEDYKGASAGSTAEVKGLAAFIDEIANSTAGGKMYMDVHSYSQLFMSAYGWTCTQAAANAAELNSLTAGFADALADVYGTRYDSGPICQTIYPVSGDSVDYAYDNAGIPYSFTPELRDTGRNGFVLPASQILPSVIETYAGLKYLLANMD